MIRTALLAAGLSLCTACGGPSEQQHGARVEGIAGLTGAEKANLARKRVFFGHQSVGADLMDGVTDLVRRDDSLALLLVGANDAPPVSGGYFAHALVGRNQQPMLKTDDFARRIESGLGSRVDIAFHKYCYLDIVEGTDIAKVFAHYRETMERLSGEFPQVTFLHVTVPLTRLPWRAKALVKWSLGRGRGDWGDNARREEYNELVRAHYGGREPVFDLARLESTGPDGHNESFSFLGRDIRGLLADYTEDGGHLNVAARRRIAEELLVSLAQAPPRAR